MYSTYMDASKPHAPLDCRPDPATGYLYPNATPPSPPATELHMQNLPRYLTRYVELQRHSRPSLPSTVR